MRRRANQGAERNFARQPKRRWCQRAYERWAASRLRTLLRIEAKIAYVKLNIQLRKHSRAGRRARLVTLSLLTKGVVGGSFTLDTRIGVASHLPDEALRNCSRRNCW
jgi:hypothetical protein